MLASPGVDPMDLIRKSFVNKVIRLTSAAKGCNQFFIGVRVISLNLPVSDFHPFAPSFTGEAG